MAIYTPRQAPSRSQKNGSKPRRFTKLIGLLLRRNTRAVQFRAQTMVSGAHRAWQLKRLAQIAVLLVVLAGGLAAIVWGATQLLFRSDIFRLTDIRISGVRITTERQILDLAGLQQGNSLLQFNAKAAEAKIAAHPWVDQVKIKAQWPSAVDITVREYQPFALVNVEEGKERRLRYVSREGHVFAEVGQGQEFDFPVITGVVSRKDVTADQFVKGGLAEAACNFLFLASKGNAILPIQSVSEVHVDPQHGLIVYLLDRPFPVYFGKDRLQTKYFRLVKVLEQLYAKKQVEAVKEIRMDYSDDKILVAGAELDR
ncbi:MAG: FtsQ-type POTRA domain-containing protein [Desulfobulbaceae bacterium]|nr:FtsQ-type POTRA domain-containing protein [Desulfobulbaceae bacterium]